MIGRSHFFEPVEFEVRDFRAIAKTIAYRALIGGNIGQLGPVAEGALRGDYPTLDQVATQVCPVSSGSLDADPQSDWLLSSLRAVDSKKARRVFNACLLPFRTAPGAPFAPSEYGRSGLSWQVDHLIPSRNLNKHQPGYREGHFISNFSPLWPRRLSSWSRSGPRFRQVFSNAF